jgi:hypothetical protein
MHLFRAQYRVRSNDSLHPERKKSKKVQKPVDTREQLVYSDYKQGYGGASQVAQYTTLQMMPFTLNQIQIGQSIPELSGGKQDDFIPL